MFHKKSCFREISSTSIYSDGVPCRCVWNFGRRQGAFPSKPAEGASLHLLSALPKNIARAALVFETADAILLATGAGWSADSGLAVYNDVFRRRLTANPTSIGALNACSTC